MTGRFAFLCDERGRVPWSGDDLKLLRAQDGCCASCGAKALTFRPHHGALVCASCSRLMGEDVDRLIAVAEFRRSRT